MSKETQDHIYKIYIHSRLILQRF